MRGNARSRRSGGFEAIRKLKNGLIDVRVIPAARMTKWFFGACTTDAELVVRQFVFDRYGGSRLTYAIFEYLGCRIPIKMAMPASWRNYLASNDWPVNRFFSAIAWQGAMALRHRLQFLS